MRSATVIRKEGMNCLLKTLGVIETEAFISSLLRERFDYTEWQREYFDKYTLDDFLRQAADYDKNNPFITDKSSPSVG
jgi:hypothetical protein